MGNTQSMKKINYEDMQTVIKNPEIYLIDLSTIDGISDAKMIMQAGDIVYIDPFINYANFIVTDIGGVMGLLSSVIIVYSLFLGRNTRL